MYSVLTIPLVLLYAYVIVDATKVIKWPMGESEPIQVKHEQELLEVPYEDNIDNALKEKAIQEVPIGDNDINQPAGIGLTTEETELNNTEHFENLETQNKQANPASKIKKSRPTCLIGFVGTFIYDLMQKASGRMIVSTFLNAFIHTTSNSVSSSMYLHISRQFKNFLKDSKGSQSIFVISKTFKTLLIDDGVFKNFNIMIQNFRMVLTRLETMLLVKNMNELAISLTVHPRSRRIIRVFGEGILSVLKLPDSKNSIIKGLEDLRSYTWPDVTSQNTVFI